MGAIEGEETADRRRSRDVVLRGTPDRTTRPGTAGRMGLSALAFATLGATWATYVAYRGEMYRRALDAPTLSLYAAVVFAAAGAVHGLVASTLGAGLRRVGGRASPAGVPSSGSPARASLDAAYRDGIFFLAAFILAADALRRYALRIDPMPPAWFAAEVLGVFGLALTTRFLARAALCRPRSWARAHLVAGVAILCVGGSLVSLDHGAVDGTPSPEVGPASLWADDPPVPAGREGCKVLVIGLDGGDWSIFRPLMEAGRMPNLARLHREGASAVLPSEPPFISAAVWTTISTGRPKEEHGVVDHLSAMVPGVSPFQPERLFQDPITLPAPLISAPFLVTGGYEAVPVRGEAVRAPTFWELAAAAGRRVRLVGWPVTYPAGALELPGEGHQVVSERFFRSSWEAFYEFDPAIPGAVRPDGLGAELLDRHTSDLREVPWEEVESFLPLDAEEREVVSRLETSFASPHPATLLTLEYMGDRLKTRVARDLARRTGPADACGVFLGGLDMVTHAYWQYAHPEEYPATEPREVERLGGVIDAYAATLDRFIGEILEACADEDTVVVVCSDHGAVSNHWNPVWKGWHGPEGILCLAGPGIPAGARLDDPALVDLAPTVLHLLGLPRGAGMEGRVLAPARARH